MKLLTSAEMRDLEQRAAEAGAPADELMEQAGLAVAQEAWMQLGSLEDRRIVVLVGPGHNGGDALVAARHLAEWGAQVRCYALKLRGDERWSQAIEAGAACGAVEEDENFEALDALFVGAEMVIDGLLGTGRSRPFDGDLAEMMRRLGAARLRTVPPKLIAVDLPSGVDADSGRVDPLSVAADETVTFHAPKVGLYLQPGASLAGSVQAVEIGIPPELDDHLGTELLERRTAKALLPIRAPDSHKGTHGTLLIVAGSLQYPGAAILAANAAYRAGAGLVAVAAPASLVGSMVAAAPEATWLPLPDAEHPGAVGPSSLPLLHEALESASALAVGCGLGRHSASGVLVHQLLSDAAAAGLSGIVVDADALNHLAAGPGWSAAAPLIFTPHPGEMARLTDRGNDDVQAARLDLARDSAAEWEATVVLKGANTVIAAADGRARVSEAAQPALATAGTGDVLSGAIGALLAQGLAPFDAAALGVYLHADAGSRAARARGTLGVVAGDVADHLALAARSLSGEEPIEAPALGGGLGLGGNLEQGFGGGPAGLDSLFGGQPE